MHLFWEQPREWVDLKTARALLSIPYPEREVHPDLGAPVTREFGLARIQLIGPSDVVVCTEPFEYPALFWNDTYSNQVRFQHNGPNFLARAEAIGATWVCLHSGILPVRGQGRTEELGRGRSCVPWQDDFSFSEN